MRIKVTLLNLDLRAIQPVWIAKSKQKSKKPKQKQFLSIFRKKNIAAVQVSWKNSCKSDQWVRAWRKLSQVLWIEKKRVLRYTKEHTKEWIKNKIYLLCIKKKNRQREIK